MTALHQPHHCHFCGAIGEDDEGFCWHCDTPRQQPVRATRPRAEVPRTNQQVRPRSFSLGSLLLVTTVVSLVLGSFVLTPWLGVPLGLLFSIAWLRTALAVGEWKRRGYFPSGGETLFLFMRAFGTTLAVVLLIVANCYFSGLAGGLVYFLVNFFGYLTGIADIVAGVVGGISGWVIGIWVFIRVSIWLFWIKHHMFVLDPYD